MSILLSAYYPEGIVFVADKNVTSTYISSGKTVVDPIATKVLAWPNKRAIVGCVGLGTFGGGLTTEITTEKWIQSFIAETREFDDISKLASNLRDKAQEDFDKDYPPSSNLSDEILVIHLGGYILRDSIQTPVMYHIYNHGNIDPKTGYPPAQRKFALNEDIERDFRASSNSGSYPVGVHDWLEDMIRSGEYKWYNNGANLAAFNTFKYVIWHSLRVLQDAGFAPSSSGLTQRIAFCKMAVEVFSSFFTNYFPPDERVVGGGVDEVFIPWPK